jgi:hypothetical protein
MLPVSKNVTCSLHVVVVFQSPFLRLLKCLHWVNKVAMYGNGTDALQLRAALTG